MYEPDLNFTIDNNNLPINETEKEQKKLILLNIYIYIYSMYIPFCVLIKFSNN